MNIKKLAAAFSPIALTRAVSTNELPVKTTDGMLVGANGMTLDTFDKDEAGSGLATLVYQQHPK